MLLLLKPTAWNTQTSFQSLNWLLPPNMHIPLISVLLFLFNLCKYYFITYLYNFDYYVLLPLAPLIPQAFFPPPRSTCTPAPWTPPSTQVLIPQSIIMPYSHSRSGKEIANILWDIHSQQEHSNWIQYHEKAKIIGGGGGGNFSLMQKAFLLPMQWSPTATAMTALTSEALTSIIANMMLLVRLFSFIIHH